MFYLLMKDEILGELEKLVQKHRQDPNAEGLVKELAGIVQKYGKPEDLKGLKSVKDLVKFATIIRTFLPSPEEIREIPSVEILGLARPLREVGGNLVAYVNFNRRFDLDARIQAAVASHQDDIVQRLRNSKQKVGILLSDISGHELTDATLSILVYYSFFTGAAYEMDRSGQITTGLFAKMNNLFYRSPAISHLLPPSHSSKYLTMLYGEVNSKGGFRFISAGHPDPFIFSRERNRREVISPEKMVRTYPMGWLPIEPDVDLGDTGEIHDEELPMFNYIELMGWGDIMILYTDGLSEHGRLEGKRYFPDQLERLLKSRIEGRPVVDFPSRDIYHIIMADLVKHAPIGDDISYVVVKKTR